MRRTLAGLLAVFATATGAVAQAPPPPQATSDTLAVSDLIGLDPAALRARLTIVPADWPPPTPLLEMQTAQGRLSLFYLDEALVDPVQPRWNAALRAHQDPGPLPGYLRCTAKAVRASDPATSLSGLDLVFRDGRLDSIYGLPPFVPPPAGSYPHTMAEARAFSKRPRPNPFAARPGDLPLADGDGFLSRWNKQRVAPEDRIALTCTQTPPPPVRTPARRPGGLSASDMQGLALLPFAITLPFTNAHRTEAMEQGGALVASLHLGQPLGEPVERFAADHPGVRAFRGLEPDYAVLAIDRGALPSNNLSSSDGAALVGVRAGVVTWIFPRQGGNLGFSQDILCQDAQGVPGTVRPGCTDYGFYRP